MLSRTKSYSEGLFALPVWRKFIPKTVFQMWSDPVQKRTTFWNQIVCHGYSWVRNISWMICGDKCLCQLSWRAMTSHCIVDCNSVVVLDIRMLNGRWFFFRKWVDNEWVFSAFDLCVDSGMGADLWLLWEYH